MLQCCWLLPSPGGDLIQLGQHLLLVLSNWGLCVQLRAGKQCSGFGSCPKRMQQQAALSLGCSGVYFIWGCVFTIERRNPEMLFCSAWPQLSRRYKWKEVRAQCAIRKAIAPCEYRGVLRCSQQEWLLHVSQLAKSPSCPALTSVPTLL